MSAAAVVVVVAELAIASRGTMLRHTTDPLRAPLHAGHRIAQPRIVVSARFKTSDKDFGHARFPLAEGLPLSIFHPYKRLPPEGATCPIEEELCEPAEERCKTPLHVYEARCTNCASTGWSRLPSNGRRGHLATCVACHGLGFVRRTTARFVPDDPDRHQTMARPLLYQGRLPAHLLSRLRSRSSNGNARAVQGDGSGTSEEEDEGEEQ